MKTATIAATLALGASYALAAPAPLDNNIKRATITYNGRLIDCSRTAFLDIYPPTDIELKCRAAQGIRTPPVERDQPVIDELSKRAIVQHNGRTINCDEIAFLAVMPPSELELKCRAAEGKPSGPIAWDEKRDVAIRSVVVGKRAVIEFEGRTVDCENTVFLAVFPPTEVEMACRAAEERK